MKKLSTVLALVTIALTIAGTAQTEKSGPRVVFEDGYDYRLEFELQMACVDNQGHKSTPVVEPSEFDAVPAEKLLLNTHQVGDRQVVLSNIHEYWTEFEVEDSPSEALARRGVAIRPLPKSASYPDLVKQFLPVFRYRYERRTKGGSPTSFEPVSDWSGWQILRSGEKARTRDSEGRPQLPAPRR